MPKVTFIKAGKKIVAEGLPDESLLELAEKTDGVDMMSACGGNGMCITCMCDVKEGKENLSALTEAEELMGFTKESTQRLGCQARPEGDVEVEITM